MTEREVKRLREEIEGHYPDLCVTACGELIHGAGWELIVRDQRGTERLIRDPADLRGWNRRGTKTVPGPPGFRQRTLF